LNCSLDDNQREHEGKNFGLASVALVVEERDEFLLQLLDLLLQLLNILLGDLVVHHLQGGCRCCDENVDEERTKAKDDGDVEEEPRKMRKGEGLRTHWKGWVVTHSNTVICHVGSCFGGIYINIR
jgi:hypothetical protein